MKKMRISPMSVARKRLRTALPKEPVPPVIMRVLLVNRDNGWFLVCYDYSIDSLIRDSS